VQLALIGALGNRTRLDYDVFNQLTRSEIARPSIGPMDPADRKT